MHKKLLLFIIIAATVGIVGYIWLAHKNAPAPAQTANFIEYTDNQYGFSFSLPKTWEGYTIMTNSWQGNTIGQGGDVPTERGPLISVRNPKWSAQNVYQDIPIMIFTLAQWNSLQHDQFHIGAAPIGPTELGHNAKYVFALPARYNFAFPAGYEEVEKILENKPLHVF